MSVFMPGIYKAGVCINLVVLTRPCSALHLFRMNNNNSKKNSHHFKIITAFFFF